MGAFGRFMKWVAGLFGSLVMLAGFLLLFAGLISNNIVSSINDFPEITAKSIKNFVADNPDDVRDFVKDRMTGILGPTDEVFNKQNVIMMCQHPDLLLIQDDEGGFGEPAQMVQKALNTVCKEDVASMSQDEINSLIIVNQTL